MERRRERDAIPSKRDLDSSIKFCKRLYTLRQEDYGIKRIIFGWEHSAGTLLASATEGHPVVHVHNRQGQVEGQISLQGNCLALAWDADGDFLAILTEGRSSILLWEAHTKKLTEIDSSLKDTGSTLAWSGIGKVLAYGTVKGNLLIYNHRTLRKVPIIGKTSKRIISCAWSNDNIFALGTTDNVLSINNGDGDTLKVIHLQGKPQDIKFGHLKEDHPTTSVNPNAISLIVGEKTLYLHRLEKNIQGTPLELGFQSRYGNLVTHSWLGDGYILASFSAGFIVTISTHHKEIGTEIVLVELNEDPLRWTDLCSQTGQICVCYGESRVEIRDAVDPNQVKCRADLEDSMGRYSTPVGAQFSDDGQLVAIATGTGDLHVYLTSVPLLGGCSEHYLIQMSSLTEATLHGFVGPSSISKCATLTLDIEPNVLLMGGCCFGAVLNNRIWFYNIHDSLEGPPGDSPFMIKQYNSNIVNGAINDEYVAVLVGDKLCLHSVENEVDGDEREMKFFQETQGKRDNKISCLALSKDFLFFGTEQGNLRLFHLERWEELNQLIVRGKTKLRSIHPDPSGTRVILITKDGVAHFYDMRFEGIDETPEFPNRVDSVLWDEYKGCTHVFLTTLTGSGFVDVFCVWKDSKGQSEVRHVRNVKIFPTLDNYPLSFRNGIVYSQTSTGRLTRTIDIYKERPEFHNSDGGKPEKLQWLLDLRKYREAFRFCKSDKLPKSYWLKLGKAAAESLSLNYAKRAYANAGCFGMANNLAEFVLLDDLRLQAAHIAAIFQRYDDAESLFLKSSDRVGALRMRYDLRQWEEAYHLATELSPLECAEIALRFAEQDEMAKNYSRALESYSSAASYAQQYNHPREYELARIGIGRNSLRCGQIQRGIQIIAHPGVPLNIKVDCAEILESTKFLTEAALLYEEGGKIEKAAGLFIRTKNWERLDKLLPQVTSKKILLQYAKSREVEGNHKTAADSYEKAGDFVNAVRLFLKSEELESAISLVRQTGSKEGGALVANYFIAMNNYETAIRFLLISRLYEEAIHLTFEHGLFDLFVSLAQSYCEKEICGGQTPVGIANGFLKIAQFYEGLKDHFKAAKFCYLGGDLDKGFRILFRAGTTGMVQNEDEFLSLLIDIGIELTEDGGGGTMASELVEYLLGDKDGNPKDVKYLLQYYASVRREVEAVKTCLIYASDELRSGTYKNSHSAFITTILRLRTDEVRTIPVSLYNPFKLVHFYYLAKLQIEAGKDSAAARLLQYVYPEFKAFFGHGLEMLTLTVIQCSKAGLKETALNACCSLMKTEMRHDVDPLYKKKFELLVRKRGKGGLDVVDVPDEESPCPRCGSPLPNYSHRCLSCDNEIPFCIYSGRHLVAGDFTYCPYCQFPGIYSELVKLACALLENGKTLRCPICQTKRVARESYRRHGFIESYLGHGWVGTIDQSQSNTSSDESCNGEDSIDFRLTNPRTVPYDETQTYYNFSNDASHRAQTESIFRNRYD